MPAAKSTAEGASPKLNPLLRALPTFEGFKILDRRYVLFETLGKGGMGTVFRGKHYALDDHVAVKCLNAGMLDLSGDFLSRFRKEARAASMINDPHVIKVRDFAEDAGIYFLVMEYIPGANAREVVARHGPLPILDALRIAWSVAKGLAAIHAADLIHRDVKPGNILLSSTGAVKLADLGLVKFLEDDALLTMTGMGLGTRQYMAPEQFDEPHRVDPEADVYALGATLYYLLAGEDAMGPGSFVQVAKRVQAGRFPDVRRLREEVPDGVATLIQRCTRLDPGERFHGGEQVAAFLEQLLGPRVGSSLSPRVLRGVEESVEGRGAAPPPPDDTMAKIQRLLKERGRFDLGQNGAAESGDNTRVRQVRRGARGRAKKRPWRRVAFSLAVVGGALWASPFAIDQVRARTREPGRAAPPAEVSDVVVKPAERVELPSYAGRFGAKEALLENGGSGTAVAVRAGLAWLAAHQDDDGKWDCDDFYKHDEEPEVGFPRRDGGDPNHDIGVTGLALLAFLGDGHTTLRGEYRETVEKGIRWLVTERDEESGLFGEEIGLAFLYDHAIATMALCEACALEHDAELRSVAELAVRYIERARNPYGAWRYSVPPDGDSDTSVTAWMILTLKAAETCGIAIDEEAYTASLQFLDEITDEGTGRVGYTERGSPSSRVEGMNQELYPTDSGEALTAAALLCRLHLGQNSTEDSILEDYAELLLRCLPTWEPEKFGCDMYYWGHGTEAMFQMGGKYWREWNRAMKAAVLPAQQAEGDDGGSWDPVGPWGYAGGRIYATALMVQCLEVYYRYPRITPDD